MLLIALLLICFSMLAAEPRCSQRNRTSHYHNLDEFDTFPRVCVGQITSVFFGKTKEAADITKITLSKSLHNEAYFTNQVNQREILLDAFINRDWVEVAAKHCEDGKLHEFERFFVFKANKHTLQRDHRYNTPTNIVPSENLP